MRRLLLVGMMLVGLVGCGSDERQTLIEQVQGNLESAQRELSTLNRQLEKGIEKAKERTIKLNKGKKIEELKPGEVSLQVSDLKPAVDATEQLGKLGKELQTINQKARRLESNVGDAEREKYQPLIDQLQSQFKKLQAAMTKLDQTISEAKKMNGKAVEVFENAYQKALGEYETLAKQR